MSTELRIPGSIIRPEVSLKGYCFNPGMAECWGKTVIAYRFNRRPSTLYISELDDKLRYTEKTVHLKELNGVGIAATEDPRIFFLGDKIGLWYVELQDIYGNTTYVCYAELDKNYRVLSKHKLTYEKDKHIRCQKNWAPFKLDGQWLCIYNHNPFTILKKVNDKVELFYESSSSITWDYGQIRGGTPPIKIDNLWYSFFHSSLDFNDDKDPGGKGIRIYYVGCYTFDDRLNIKSMTPKPLISGSKEIYSIPWVRSINESGVKISACFPLGVLARGSKLLISYGWLDAEIRIAAIEISHIKSQLK